MQLDAGPAVIRSWRKGDEASLVANANDRGVWLNLRDAFPHPYAVADAEFRARFAAAERPESSLAVCVNADPEFVPPAATANAER